MKLFMIVDMEGVNTVVDHKRQADPSGPLYEECRRVLTDEINAVARAGAERGVERIVVYDTHFYGLNLLVDRLHPSVWPILGKPVDNQLDSSYAGLILLGFHAMAGTPGSLIPHTYNLDIETMHLNGIRIGEIGMEAAVAAQKGVPLIMVTGDDKGVEEARQLLPGIETIAVKYAVDDHSALCRPVEETVQSIQAAASKAIERIQVGDKFTLRQFGAPFSLLIRLSKTFEYPPSVIPRTCRIQDNCTLEFSGASLNDLWLDCRRTLKI